MRIFSGLNIFNRFRQARRAVKPQAPMTAPTSLTRPTFRTASTDGCVVHASIPVVYKDGQGTLSTICDDVMEGVVFHHIKTVLRNANGQQMGKYSYTMDTRGKEIACGYIKTDEPFRHRGIAEIMRLSSIMEIKENKISKLEILALPNAIPFHSKYKFSSNIQDKYKALSVLDSIANKTEVDDKYKKAALKYRKVLKKMGFVPSLDEKSAKSVNKFIDKYIEGNKNNWDKANFGEGLPMILTDKDIQQNSEFFNQLFQKHGIDYTV